MPFASQAQQRFAFGTGQPWAKRWAAETDFSKLPKRVKRIRSRMGLKGCTCKATTEGTTTGRAQGAAAPTKIAGGGGSLGPGITRIRGNLCNVHGRYGPCDGGKGGKKPKGGKGKKPKKAKPTPEQKRQAREQQHADNRKKVLASLNIAPDGQAALEALRAGQQPDADAIARGGFEQAGLVERARDGSYRLSASGRAAMAAAEQGDAGRVGDIISGARDRTTARGERAAAQQERHRQAEVRRQQIAARRAAREAVRNKRSQKMQTLKAGSPGDYLVALDRTKPTTWHLQVKRGGKPDHGLMGAAWAALHSGYRGNTYAGPNKGEAISKLRALYAAEKMPVPESKEVTTFAVYKDTSGTDRWLSVSSTAYRDRDQEIVSTKALTRAVAQADASGARGPLRFWHVPGLDMGDCDFQATAQNGRFLIESGTFRSPALAAAIKAHADDYAMSIGFTHPADEPDATGVFSHITIFERSLVPKGRASNPFTQITTAKEQRMLTTEKQEQLSELLSGNSDLLRSLLSQVATTDKEQQAAGTSYKDAPDLRAIIREELAALLSTTKAVETEKAADAPLVEGSPEEEATESPEEAMAEGDTGDENMLTDAEIGAIAQQTAQVLLDALMPHLGIGQKMDEVKSMLGGMAGSYAKKDAEMAEVKADLATVKAQVADLSGSTPRILAGGYRASTAASTVTTDEKLKEAQPAADPAASAFGAFMSDLGFGQPTQPGAS